MRNGKDSAGADPTPSYLLVDALDEGVSRVRSRSAHSQFPAARRGAGCGDAHAPPSASPYNLDSGSGVLGLVSLRQSTATGVCSSPAGASSFSRAVTQHAGRAFNFMAISGCFPSTIRLHIGECSSGHACWMSYSPPPPFPRPLPCSHTCVPPPLPRYPLHVHAGC